MKAKIKVICNICTGQGYRKHDHTNKCYSGLERDLLCYRSEKLKESCLDCNSLGYIIYIGEILELNPPE